jgi:hypothetical protein
VTPETLRLSVGIEDIADIVEDLDQALSAAVPSGGAPDEIANVSQASLCNSAIIPQ